MIINRIITASLVIAFVLGSVACSEQSAVAPDSADDTTSSQLPIGLVISNPHSGSTSAAVGLVSISASAESIVYVSSPPKTLPHAVHVRISNRNTGRTKPLVPMIDGGFDPVPIEARAGDVLDLTISTTDGGTIAMVVKVPVRHPPSVVRTDPPKGRTDVALNVTVTVIFSEPIDPNTLNTSTVRLLRDGKAVSGSVRVSNNALTAEFVPDNPLEARSSYELVVTQAIRDLDGDSLSAPQSVTFTTGVLSSDVVLTGFYSASVAFPLFEDDSVASHTITLQLEHSGSRLSGTWTIDGSPSGPRTVDAGVFSSSSSENNFGAVHLFLRVSPVAFWFELVAEVTKADGSELSGVLYNLDTFGSGFDPPFGGMPIVLKRIPFPTGGNGSVAGVVAERTPAGLRPLANVTVFAWVQTGPNGSSHGGVQTDANGRYRVDLLPIGSTVFLSPSYPETYDQPCASIAELSAPSTTMDIELVSVDHPLPDAATSSPLIWGVVYETKGNVRQPVPRARLALDVGADMRGANDGGVVVTTTTDESGRYALCRLPSGGELDVVKDGYAPYRQVIAVTGSTQVDIELKH